MDAMCFYDLRFDVVSFALLHILLASNVLRIVVMFTLHLNSNAKAWSKAIYLHAPACVKVS
jgi:hypothetical protein